MASRKQNPIGKAGASSKGRPAKEPPKSKQQRMIDMLRRPEGATIAQLGKAFGWQPHTVRGAISGALKTRLGLKVASEKREDGERTYRIA